MPEQAHAHNTPPPESDLSPAESNALEPSGDLTPGEGQPSAISHSRRDRQLSPEERQQRDQERRNQLKLGLTTHFVALAEELALGKSDRLMKFLTCAVNLIRLSPANQELVYSQRPDAAFVATYQTWVRDYNRTPKKGEKAIWIVQGKPYAYLEKAEDTNGEAEQQEAPSHQKAERVKVGTSFRYIAEFDISQTVPIPGLPIKEPSAFFIPLAGPEGMEELCARLQAAMEHEGISVSESISTEGAEGYNLPNIVVTREGLAPTNKALVLIHEWTHNYLHRTPEARYFPKGKRECHAEATAYIVMRFLTGFESPFTRDYLLHYENKPKELQTEMEAILGAAQHIIEAIYPQALGVPGFSESEQEPEDTRGRHQHRGRT